MVGGAFAHVSFLSSRTVVAATDNVLTTAPTMMLSEVAGAVEAGILRRAAPREAIADPTVRLRREGLRDSNSRAKRIFFRAMRVDGENSRNENIEARRKFWSRVAKELVISLEC